MERVGLITWRKFRSVAAVSIAAKIAQLAVFALAARTLPVEHFGVFAFAMGVGMLGGHLGTLGWPLLLTRLIPKFMALGETGYLRGALLRGYQSCSCGALVVITSCLIAAAAAPKSSELREGLFLGAALVPLVTWKKLLRQIFVALGRQRSALACDELGPAIGLLGAVAVLGQLELVELWVVFLGAAGLSALIGEMLIRGHFRRFDRSAFVTFEDVTWLRAAIAGLVAVSGKLMMDRVDVILLAPLAGAEAVGAYAAISRLTYAVTFLPTVVSSLYAARFSSLFSKGARNELRACYGEAVLRASCVAVAMSAPLCLYPSEIIALIFDLPLDDEIAALRILVLGQVVWSVNIINLTVLLMMGDQKWVAQNSMVVLVGFFLFSAVLINYLGLLGAAVSGFAVFTASTALFSVRVVERLSRAGV